MSKHLRIISGKAKGHKIFSVPGDSTRPITDRAKEALFNIIGNDIIDATFLDLFAGTGSVGIEALSRGAKFSVFIDKNRRAIQTLKKNLSTTKLLNNAEIIHTDAFLFLQQTINNNFDYVFIAPPQYKELWSIAITSLDKHIGWISEDAWVIVQIHPAEYKKLDLYHLTEFDQRKYGSVLLIFYEKKT